VSAKTNRLLSFILILGLLLFLGLAFSSWTIPNIVTPAALTIWIFIRIFILSLDQQFYWWLLILFAILWIFYRLIRQGEPIEPVEYVSHNEALSNLKNWQDILVYSKKESSQYSLSSSILKQKLTTLLTSYYAARQQGPNDSEIYKALESGQLPLPKALYHFIFLPEPAKANRLSIHSLSQACRHWYRQLTGKNAAEFDRMIDELIRFIENTPEI
jgi:hypothetical protein